MARIAGIDLPRNKRIEIGLTYVYGIGRPMARQICKLAGFATDLRVDKLTDNDAAKIREILEEKKLKVEGDLKRDVGLAIKRLMDVGCYRGIRHRKGLPVRGQSTRQNARTRKGPKKTVANKKKVTM